MTLECHGKKLTKICAKCNEDKSSNEFYIYSGKLSSYCKRCSNLNSKKYRRDNYEHFMILQARSRAKRSGVPCTITTFDFHIPTHCPVLGTPIEKFGESTDNSPSLDKIVPELGYVAGNVQVISNRANRIKSDGNPNELLKVACYMMEGLNTVTGEEDASMVKGS